MSDPFEGFYSAYFSGKESNGFAVFVFTAGRIVGADPLGVLFNGHYRPKQDGTGYDANVRVAVPKGGTTIQGVSSGPDGFTYEANVELPSDFAQRQFLELTTPLGRVNVRFVRLRGMDE